MKIKPINYIIEFEPSLTKFTFEGRETIEVEIATATNKIVLNAAELKIKKSTVRTKEGTLTARTKLNAQKELLEVILKKKVSGRVFLDFDFSGTLNDRLLGFYRSKYTHNGKTKYLATTQFEAADARRAFPCWDEPEAKATFEISLITTQRQSAISNMPVASKQKKGTKTIHKFTKTPKMSTYLIYLGVGEFEFLQDKIGKVQLRVVTTKGNKSKGKYALELLKKLLPSYENYFGIKYPLPKLDLIAIPDFAAGAMENWGAITFRETLLLYDPKTSSTKTKQFIAEVISHELAHQWFGNLVTMRWWNDLWLNESFATFMATKFVDKLYPEWNLWDQFIEDAMNTAMNLDALKSTHPIDVKVSSPTEIREIFDAISYDKGGCVLRMLEDYVGESSFRNGLKKYLTNYRYQNASGTNLWNSIGVASNRPVTKMVNSWLKQAGFPLLQVNKQGNQLTLNQKRFFLESKKSSASEVWHVPISAGITKPAVKRLMTTRSTKMRLPRKNMAFLVNLGKKGFYRVKYDQSTQLDLKLLIDLKKINTVDRWAVQNDMFAMCVSDDESIRNYLDFIDSYFNESEYLPLINIAHNLHFLNRLTFWEDFGYEINNYCLHYFKKILSDLGWEPKKTDKPTDALLRSFAISTLGRLGDIETISKAENKFNKFLKNKQKIHPDVREAVYGLVAWNGTSKTHSKLIELYKKTDYMEEKLRFLSALCNFSDENLLLKTLEFSQTDHVRSQNMQLPIMRIAGNPHGSKILWPWLKKNWKKISNKVGYGNPLFNRIVASIALVADSTMEDDIRKFFRKNPTPGTERTQEQTLERIRIYSKFLQRLRTEYSITTT